MSERGYFDALADRRETVDARAIPGDVEHGGEVERDWDPNELVEPVGYPDGLARGEDWQRGDWMQTFTGKRFFPTDPRAEEIDPVDIAHALSLTCRFGGHVSRFYSVAEHCVVMAQYALDNDLDADVVRWALLHDASEAYVGDMVRPLKLQMPAYVEAEDRVIAAIAERFGLALPMPKQVKELDNRILLDEREKFLGAPAARWTEDHLEPLGVYLHGHDPRDIEKRYTSLLWEVIA